VQLKPKQLLKDDAIWLLLKTLHQAKDKLPGSSYTCGHCRKETQVSENGRRC
jgi:hypothetical protein